MQKTARCIIKSTHKQFKVLDDITHKAKNLYNYANYQMRQHFFATGLFKSSTGALLNADVNGCIGIARKVFSDAVIRQIIDSGVGMTPSKRNALYHSHFEFEKVS